MSVSNKQLISPKTMEAAQTTQYTVPSNKKTIIDTFTATNYGALTATISINLVPNAATPGNDNLIIKEHELAPGETYPFFELVGSILLAGAVISTTGSGASIAIQSSGREIT